MRKIVFILFFLSVASLLSAQTVLDTLCAGPYSEEYNQYWNRHRTRSRIFEGRCVPELHSGGGGGDVLISPKWLYVFDSTITTPPNIKFFKKGEVGNDDSLDGWYIITENFRGERREVGLYPLESDAMDAVRAFAYTTREIFACFKECVPCCTWHYIYRKYGNLKGKELVARGRGWEQDRDLIDSLFKSVNFDNGLLHGDYTVYNGADTIYHTTFHHGTGRYKDFYVDGTLMMEGDVVNGYRDGVWVYYFYKEDKKLYREVLLEHFDRNDLFTLKNPLYVKRHRFITDSLVRKALRWEYETPKWKKRQKENPIVIPYIRPPYSR